MIATDTLFLWDNPAPQAWQDAVDAACPSGDKLSRFLIVWEPGEPQNPIQRYTLWQMRPVATTRKMLSRRRDGKPLDPRLMGLVEEHPRKNARWDTRLGCYRKVGGHFAATDRLTWELYHRTGMYGTRWWVVQGANGGHRYQLTHTERKLWQTRVGAERDAPQAGDLPYAPVDERVLQQLRMLESVATWHRVVQKADAGAAEAVWDADEQTAAEVARASLSDWLDRQFSGTWEDHAGTYKAALREVPKPHLPKEDRAKPDDADAWREQFVKFGS